MLGSTQVSRVSMSKRIASASAALVQVVPSWIGLRGFLPRGNILGGVINAIVLSRPKSIAFEQARAEALTAIRAYVAVYRT